MVHRFETLGTISAHFKHQGLRSSSFFKLFTPLFIDGLRKKVISSKRYCIHWISITIILCSLHSCLRFFFSIQRNLERDPLLKESVGVTMSFYREIHCLRNPSVCYKCYEFLNKLRTCGSLSASQRKKCASLDPQLTKQQIVD